MDTYKDAISIAAGKLGFADREIKSHQIEVVLSLVTGNDVFEVLPIGYGKSLRYACLPIVSCASKCQLSPSIKHTRTFFPL